MEASRLSIGLALVWAPHARLNVLAESTYFWLHHMDAFMKLAIASDRLRDLLVITCAGEMPDVFKKANRQNNFYATAFLEAETLLFNRGLKDVVEIYSICRRFSVITRPTLTTSPGESIMKSEEIANDVEQRRIELRKNNARRAKRQGKDAHARMKMKKAEEDLRKSRTAASNLSLNG